MPLIHQSTFTAANGTLVTAYTPDVGNALTVLSGTTPTIQSNRLQETTAGGQIVTSTSAANVMMSLDLVTLSNGYSGFTARAQDSSNYLFGAIGSDGTNAHALTLWKRVSGSNSLVLSGGASFVGAPCTLLMWAIGNDIILSDGTNTIHAVISNFSSSTSHGIYLSGTSAGVVDNFKIWSPSSQILTSLGCGA